MKSCFFSETPLFGQSFYTDNMAYARREQEPFPPVNVYFCGKHIIVQALLPGIDLSDIHIQAEHDLLTLEGHVQRKNGRFLHEECYSGHFRRQIALGADICSEAKMELRYGILQVVLQRKEKP